MDIIQLFIESYNSLYQQFCWLLGFICRYIPLKQWAFDDSHSPKYQKFKTDELPVIKPFIKQDWKLWNSYYKMKYGKMVAPVRRRNGRDVPENISCPVCDAPHQYIYDNTGGRGQFACKICGNTFVNGEKVTSNIKLLCPHCGHALVPKKDRKNFTVHKCVNPKCPYYVRNLRKVDKADLEEDYGKNKYKLHYIYREFNVDFFRMDLDQLPKNTSSLRFSKHDAHIMSLCLTLHVNLQLSLRKTAQAMHDLYGVSISHQQVANYCRTAALLVKPFVDHFEYDKYDAMVADETYIKVHGVKGYVWFIIDAMTRSIIGYRVSENRSVGPCIMAMRMAFRGLKELSDRFLFVADGFSAYPLAAQQFAREFGQSFAFRITQVIGLTNEDEVSSEYRPYKQVIERMNRTFKESYRCTCGYHNFEGANYALSLWVAYYNFLRPHKSNGYDVLNHVDLLDEADNMPAKWQLLMYLGQKTILHLSEQPAAS